MKPPPLAWQELVVWQPMDACSRAAEKLLHQRGVKVLSQRASYPTPTTAAEYASDSEGEGEDDVGWEEDDSTSEGEGEDDMGWDEDAIGSEGEA